MNLDRPLGANDPGLVDWEELARDERFTESHADLTKLYDVVRYGQLNQDMLDDLSDEQLVWLAAHDPAVASFDRQMTEARDEIETTERLGDRPAMDRAKKKFDDIAAMKNKLEQNARRARFVLEHRELRATRKFTARLTLWAASISVVSGLIGVGLGALLRG